jgi:hypothetical protein
MLTHAGVCNFHANRPANILVDALVRKAHAFLTVTTLSFDMSVKEVGTPLVNGLAVVLADETQTNDPGKLAELFRATGADAFNATHSRLRQYLEHPAFARAIGECNVVLSGGEKYTEGLLPRLQKTTGATIINTYGPTETCVSSNMADLTHADRITVGRPLYNVWECVVDADNNELLLRRMKGRPRRSCAFQCAIALARPGEETLIAEGSCPGTLLEGLRGEGGFGYDPLFLYEPLGKTFAEVTEEEKNAISHRARACEKMLAIMKEIHEC